MTVQLLAPYSTYSAGASVDLDNATESALVAQGLAIYTSNPGPVYSPLSPQETQWLRDSGIGGTSVMAKQDASSGLFVTAAGQSWSPQMGESVVIFGDSMTQRCTSFNTPTSVTRSGGVVTCTLTSHGLGSGQLIDFNNATDSTYNVRNVVVTRTGANTFTFPANGPDGTPTAISGRSLIVTIQQELKDDGYWVWLNAKLGGGLRLVRNSGVSSNNSTDMLARVTADVLAYQSDWVFFQPTIYNDVVNAGYTLAQIISLNASILLALRNAGRKVLLIGPPAFNTGNTAALYQIWLGAQKWMRDQARTTPGVYFADVMRYQVNATAGTPGNAISGMLAADGIHESSRGAERKAQACFDAIGNVIPRINLLVSSSGDSYGTNSANTNVLDYAPWANSGGTVNAGSNSGTNSGTVGTGWQVDCNGGGAASTAVWSMPARVDGIGYDMQCVFTPAANNAYILASLASNIAIARAPAGTKLRFSGEISLFNVGGSGLRTINAIISFQGGSNPTSGYVVAGAASAQTSWLQQSYGTLVSDTLTSSLTPSLVGANTTAEQTFTIAGLMVGDVVSVTKPTAQAGLGIVGARVSATDTLAITFSNNTGAGITPTAAETYSVTYTRKQITLTLVSNDITVPTDSGITGFTPQLYFVAGGSGTAVTIRMGRMSLEKVG